jgi:glyoxylase-like metal-dependent hydrolase (beta-lactamase superfamily II)
MKVANGIEVLEISSSILGMQQTIYPTLIWDEEAMILIDAGFPGQLPLIRNGLQRVGLNMDRVSKIIVTHHDIDHIGSLSSIRKELPEPITVLAHEEEKAYIDGEKQPLKVAQLESNFSLLSEEMKTTYQKLKAAFQSSKTPVDETLTDGQELPYCGGITVIHTPGHTLGHICLYLEQNKILIAGDALEVEQGKLITAPPATNYDMALCKKSLKKLTNYDIETIICYHGGLYQDQPNEHIAALAKDADQSSV